MLMVPTVVAPSIISMSPPSAFKLISPATSIVRLPELTSISCPSIVILSIVTPPSKFADVPDTAPLNVVV